MNFAIIGLGFISSRHIKAIQDIGGNILCACDIDESKWGIFELVDKKPKLFVNWIEMLENKSFRDVEYVSILTPNNLHLPMTLKCRAKGKIVICEKPFCLSMEDLNKVIEDPYINILLQLRYAYNILNEKKYHTKYNAIKMYINVCRGDWYFKSWKVDEKQSGGLLWNIGVHYFDLIDREFGPFIDFNISMMDDRKMHGFLYNGKSKVDWNLSIEAPIDKQERRVILNRIHDIDLTNYTYGMSDRKEVFSELHTRAYRRILEGEGVKPKDIIRTTKLLCQMTERAMELRDGSV